MHYLLPRRGLKLKGALLAAAVAAVVMAMPGVASAGVWGLKSLPGKTWSIVELIGPGLHHQVAYDHTTSTLCVGPAEQVGKEFRFPYGWGCQSGGAVEWEYPPLEAAPAVYNPNSGTMYELWGASEY